MTWFEDRNGCICGVSQAVIPCLPRGSFCVCVHSKPDGHLGFLRNVLALLIYAIPTTFRKFSHLQNSPRRGANANTFIVFLLI